MKRKILIVEDYEDARLFMKYLLESYGYQVIEAGDGLEAIESLKSNFPDLILMDISLPVMDGLTAAETIRKKFKRGVDVPIIAVTIHGKELYRKALAAGFNDLLTKPVDFETLENILSHYLDE
jgi:CheY-like chemotaxis protein